MEKQAWKVLWLSIVSTVGLKRKCIALCSEGSLSVAFAYIIFTLKIVEALDVTEVGWSYAFYLKYCGLWNALLE